MGLIVATVLGVFPDEAQRSRHAREAKENAVRSSIESFDTAIRQGDLATLRSITCGQSRDSYVDYDPGRMG